LPLDSLLVVEEIKHAEQRQAINKYQNENRLTVLELDETEIMNAWNMPTEWALKRITDRSVLLKAVQLKCRVLRNGQIITCKFDMLSFHPDDPSF